MNAAKYAVFKQRGVLTEPAITLGRDSLAFDMHEGPNKDAFAQFSTPDFADQGMLTAAAIRRGAYLGPPELLEIARQLDLNAYFLHILECKCKTAAGKPCKCKPQSLAPVRIVETMIAQDNAKLRELMVGRCEGPPVLFVLCDNHYGIGSQGALPAAPTSSPLDLHSVLFWAVLIMCPTSFADLVDQLIPAGAVAGAVAVSATPALALGGLAAAVDTSVARPLLAAASAIATPAATQAVRVPVMAVRAQGMRKAFTKPPPQSPKTQPEPRRVISSPVLVAQAERPIAGG